MADRIPPGPRYPSPIQAVGFWSRPLPFLERCRARYGKRFTIRLPGAPPFVMLTEPAQVKQVYTAPADVLHPGEGARVLEPVVGRNSVILLDEDAHMEQRKLMLPAFHGEKMERLSGLIAEVAEGEIASRPGAGFFRTQAQADELIFELIDERRAEAGERDDVLGMLLEARHEDGSPMSSQELRDALMTLLVAGHETTASTLAWTFERLVRAPEALARLNE
jgi:cytochrome P450